MLIDWFTVAVQIVNFLILIALLRRFLYRPLLRVMDERQQGIDARLAQAAAAKQEAAGELTALARERQELAASREGLLAQAASEVEAWKEATLARIKEEVAENRQLWQRQVQAEQEAFLQQMKVRVGEQVVRVAGKVMADLADESLEERVVERFMVQWRQELSQGRGLEPGELGEPGELVVATGQLLSPRGQDALRQALAARLGTGWTLRCLEEPELGFGIRLTTADYAWEWNLSHYLSGLEQEIRHTLSVAGKAGEML